MRDKLDLINACSPSPQMKMKKKLLEKLLAKREAEANKGLGIIPGMPSTIW